MTNDGPKVLDHLKDVPPIEFRLEGTKKWSRLIFFVRNKGTAEISKPIVRIVVSPETVFLDRADMRLAERVEHNTLQFSGPTINDIEPEEVIGGSVKYLVDVTVPDSITTFDLSISITGKNLPRKEHELHLKVIRRSSLP